MSNHFWVPHDVEPPPENIDKLIRKADGYEHNNVVDRLDEIRHEIEKAKITRMRRQRVSADGADLGGINAKIEGLYDGRTQRRSPGRGPRMAEPHVLRALPPRR